MSGTIRRSKMDKRILKTFLLFILLGAFPCGISGGKFCNNPTPPVCADDCDGNGYYISQDGTACIQCPQCPAGQELNKDCGNGLNGDAVCIPCGEGFFSLSTSQRCTQCTTCTNTVEQEPCQLTQNRVCGDCLPGYYQDTDGYFPDQGACPNKCPKCPNTVPQCQEWCELRTNSDQVTVDPGAESVGQDDVTPSGVAVDIFRSDADIEINDEANPPSASHGSYMLIFTVLASVLAVVVIVLIIVLFVSRCLWNFNAVYEPTTYSYSPERDWEFVKQHLRTASPRLTSSRPVSAGSTDVESGSSAVSTPTMNINRLLRHALERPVGVDHDDSPRSTPPHPLKHPRLSSPGKVVTERESGIVHPHVEDENEAHRTTVRRRRSFGSIDNSEILKKLQNGHNGNTAPLMGAEAALFPTDSSRDDGPTTNVPEDTNNNKSANPKQLSRSLKPNASYHTTLTDVIRENADYANSLTFYG